MSVKETKYKWNHHRDELIVTGYIRAIQPLLRDDQIIASPLYFLCYSFYHIKYDTILWLRRVRDDQYSIIWRDFAVLDVENKKSATITLNNFKIPNDGNYFSALCHIPNISYYIPDNMTNATNLDGILAAENSKPYNIFDRSTGSKKAYLYLILYKPPYNEVNITTEYEYKSNQQIQFASYNQFLYCNDKNIMIYENEGKLYQLSLSDIKSKDEITNFTQIQQNKNLLQNASPNCNNYLDMTYLADKQSIFAVLCRHEAFSNCTFYFRCSPREAQCGIFDIKSSKWIDIKPFKYSKKPNNSSFSCVTCYDGTDCLYLFSHCQDIEDEGKSISKYDMNKNEWYEISDIYKHEYLQTLWIDNNNNMLYGLSQSYGTGINNTFFHRYSLDLRVKATKKLIIEDYAFDGMPKDEQQYFSLFT